MNYQQAYTTRKTGLGNLIVNKIRSGQSLSGSVGRSASEKIKSYGTGLKEAFDPLNIAKKLTFGSNLAPVILGKMTGRSEQDIRYFSRDRVKKQSDRKVKSGNNYADYIAQPMLDSAVMSKLLGFMKKVDDYKVRQMETARSFHEEELMEKFQRHKEVVEVFLEAINKQRTGQKTVASKAKKQKKSLMDLPIGKIVLATGAIAAIALPTIASAKVGEPTPQEPSVPPTTPLPEVSEKGPLDTATRVPDMGKVPSAGVDTLSAIRSRESTGDYGAAFGMTRGNKQKGKKNIQLPEEFHPKKKRLDEMTIAEVRQYQNYRISKKSGSAVGAYQFVKDTLDDLIQKEKLSDDTIFNKATQDRLALRLQKENRVVLEKAGIPITPGAEYAAWYIGARGAVKVYRAVQNGEGSKSIADILHPNNSEDRERLVKNNEELGVKTGNEFFAVMQARVNQALPKVSGEEIATTSTQNASMRKSLSRPDPSRSIMFSQNNNIFKQSNIMVSPAMEYEPAPIP